MTASFACDPAEMTRLKGRHDTLRGTVDEITLPSGAINWGFLVVTSGYSKLESDGNRRRGTMHDWCEHKFGSSASCRPRALHSRELNRPYNCRST